VTNHLEDEIRAIVAGMDDQGKQDNGQTPPEAQPAQEDIQDIYVLIVREQEEDQPPVVDSTPLAPTQPVPTAIQHDSFLSAYMFVCCSLFLIFATLLFQLYCIQHPLTARITIIPTAKTVTLTGTMQEGRLVAAITLSQSQGTRATGIGHQAAAQARGYITFYNGQFQSVTIAQGTILTGANGIQVVTDQDAVIPAGNPGTGYGHITIPAHALSPGSSGNIPAYDINAACCATSVLAANLSSFSGGQDARSYTTVTRTDIHSLSTLLKTTLTRSVTGALQGQLTPDEKLALLPCSPIVTSDHQPGDEAIQVQVTVSETCTGVAYSIDELETKAASYLVTQAQHKAGAGYSLFGSPRVSVTQASLTHTSPPLVFLSFQATGTWIYGISAIAQEQIKHLIAGKTTQEAEQVLTVLPGVDHAAIKFSGFGDEMRMPKQTSNIHIILIVA